MKVQINIASSVESALHPDTAVEIEYGTQYRLHCGLVLNKYNTGTILLQGKLLPQFQYMKAELYSALKKLLPAKTRWCIPDYKTCTCNFSLEDIMAI